MSDSESEEIFSDSDQEKELEPKKVKKVKKLIPQELTEEEKINIANHDDLNPEESNQEEIEEEDILQDWEYDSDDSGVQKMRELIWNSTINKSETDYKSVEVACKKPTKKNSKKSSKNNALSIADYNKIVQQKELEIENSKTSRWSGKKFEEKRKKLGLSNKNGSSTVRKRQFNPKLPIPNYRTFKKEYDDEKYKFDITNFPSMSK